MTAIITKQNAKDGAFTGGGGGSSDKDSEFKNIHVHNDATVDGDIIMSSTNPQSLTLRLADIDASVSSYNQQTMKFTDELNNHESRIKTLEEKQDNTNDNIIFENGLHDFIITSDKLTENLDQPDLNSLSIKTEFGEYIGDVFEIELPSYMKLPKVVNGRTWCPPPTLKSPSRCSGTAPLRLKPPLRATPRAPAPGPRINLAKNIYRMT